MNLQKSKLVLGTAQLGMKYGINNVFGQPTKKESFSVLDSALANSIRTFDTAYAYGEAEKVVGSWLSERGLVDEVRIISKMKFDALNHYPDGTKFIDIVQTELEKSLRRLNLEHLDGYLFHSPHYIYLSRLVEGLRGVKSGGLVKNIGVSIYNEPEALLAVELGVDYVQIPYNVFDQRLDKTDFFDIAKKNKVTVFARSPFLQGLLLMKPDDLPTHLLCLKPHLEKFIDIARRHNLTQFEAAIRFVGVACRADNVIFGVDNEKQLREFVKNIESPYLDTDNSLIAEIRDSFGGISHSAINPGSWGILKR